MTNQLRLFFLVFVLLLIGCGPTGYELALLEFNKGNYDKAVEELDVLSKKQDRNFILYQFEKGTNLFYSGNFELSKKVFRSAIASIEKNRTTLENTAQFAQSDVRKNYIGESYDLFTANLFLGVMLFFEGNYEDAKIQFDKALLADIGQDINSSQDLVSAHYLRGLCYYQLGDYDDALIDFLKVEVLDDQFSLVYYDLYKVSKLLNSTERLEYLTDKLSEFKNSNDFEVDNNDIADLLIIGFVGYGPKKSPDEVTGLFATTDRRPYSANNFKISVVAADKTVQSYLADDIYNQAITRGGKLADVGKKVVGAAARGGVQALAGALIPGGDWLAEKALGTAEADIRYWFSLPGKIVISRARVKKSDFSTIKVDYLNNNGNSIEALTQILYYIPIHKDFQTIFIHSPNLSVK